MDEEAIAGPREGPLFAGRETLPPLWDAELVGKRLVEAFVTLDHMPRLRGPREPCGHWPRTVTEWAKRSSKRVNAGRASGNPIAR